MCSNVCGLFMVVLEVSMIELINTDTVAKLLGLSSPTLRLWRTLGKGPQYVKLGGAVRYRISDLEAWLDSNTIEPSENKKVHTATAG